MGLRRVHIALLVVAVLGAAALVVGVGLAPRVLDSGVDAPAESAASPASRWAAPAPLPLAAAQRERPGTAGLVDAEWVRVVAAAAGIPERALAAYAGAALAKHAERPDCELGWNTLAAIGWAESRHGSHGGASIADDGTVRPPIIGVALDGGTTALIADTDGGELDGDAEFDRAVGPMQFIPQSWRNWVIDASGDGIADPHNIDDAALAAANYLCRATPTLADEPSWRAGIAAYNSDPAYLDAVATVAAQYSAAAARSTISR